MFNDSFKESVQVLKPDGYVISTSVGMDLKKLVGAIPGFFYKAKENLRCDPSH